MDLLKIKSTIKAISNVIPIEEAKKEEMYNRFSSMEDKEVIKELVMAAYSLLRDKPELYDYALTVIRDINPQICPSVEAMKEKLNRMFANEVEGNMSLEENHKLVSNELIRFTKMLNLYDIDYYIVGALPCFIKLGIELFRYHDDIDIMINENDMPKLKEIIEMSGYTFHDDRFPSIERFNEMQNNKPPHTVLAQNPDNEFHLGFFTFAREKDNSITMREYSHRLEDGRVIVDVLERRSDLVGTSLRYDDAPTEYMGTSFRTSTVEDVYHLKSYMRRPKDITDVKKLEPFIDKVKLEELNKHPNEQVELHDVSFPSSTLSV